MNELSRSRSGSKEIIDFRFKQREPNDMRSEDNLSPRCGSYFMS